MTLQEIVLRVQYHTKKKIKSWDEFLMAFTLYASKFQRKVAQSSKGLSFNERFRRYDVKKATGLVAGQEGFQGRYPLPKDMITLLPTRVEVFNGCCHAEANFVGLNDISGTSQFYHPDNCCTQCKGKFPRDVRLVNGHMVLEPIPMVNIQDGLVIWYEQKLHATLDIPEVKEMTDDERTQVFESLEFPWNEEVAELIATQTAIYLMNNNTTRYSNSHFALIRETMKEVEEDAYEEYGISVGDVTQLTSKQGPIM